MNAVVHQLVDGRWRVTSAPDGWVDDGRDYPEPKASDAVFEDQADAIREYLDRTTRPEAGEASADTDGWDEDQY